MAALLCHTRQVVRTPTRYVVLIAAARPSGRAKRLVG
jgi:hypothetical protein